VAEGIPGKLCRTFMKYQEKSDCAEGGDNVSGMFTGFDVSGGIDCRLTKWLHLRGEVRYDSIPDALGSNGVSVDFGETKLDGTAVAVILAVGKSALLADRVSASP